MCLNLSLRHRLLKYSCLHVHAFYVMFLPPMDVEFFKSTEWEFYAKGTVRMLDAQHDTTTLCQAVDAQDETWPAVPCAPAAANQAVTRTAWQCSTSGHVFPLYKASSLLDWVYCDGHILHIMFPLYRASSPLYWVYCDGHITYNITLKKTCYI
jgi:hypothetical protein